MDIIAEVAVGRSREECEVVAYFDCISRANYYARSAREGYDCVISREYRAFGEKVLLEFYKGKERAIA